MRQTKSVRKYKSNSRKHQRKGNKRRRTHRSSSPNKKRKIDENMTRKTQQLSLSQPSQQQTQNPRKQKAYKLLSDIKSNLSTMEYLKFSCIVKLLHKIRHLKDRKRFDEEIIEPLLQIFNNPSRHKFLTNLKTIIPRDLQIYYISQIHKKLNEINGNTQKSDNHFVLDLCSATQKSQSLSTDWKCSNCTMDNDSQAIFCDLCGVSRLLNNHNSHHHHDKNHNHNHNQSGNHNHNRNRNHNKKKRTNKNDTCWTSNPFTRRPFVITIDGQELDKLQESDSKKLLQKLEDLRYELKDKYKIRSLHNVFSAPVKDQLSKYAPISTLQLKHFEIMQSKVNQYGAEIVNVIKQYLHENGLVSPFLKISCGSSSSTKPSTGSQSNRSAPPMFMKRRKNTNVDMNKISCLHCHSLFEKDLISQHQSQCVMNSLSPILTQGVNNIDADNDNHLCGTIIIDSDSDGDKEQNKNTDNSQGLNENKESNKSNGMAMQESMDTLEIERNMNNTNNRENIEEINETGFLSEAELATINIDFDVIGNKDNDITKAVTNNPSTNNAMNLSSEKVSEGFNSIENVNNTYPDGTKIIKGRMKYYKQSGYNQQQPQSKPDIISAWMNKNKNRIELKGSTYYNREWLKRTFHARFDQNVKIWWINSDNFSLKKVCEILDNFGILDKNTSTNDNYNDNHNHNKMVKKKKNERNIENKQEEELSVDYFEGIEDGEFNNDAFDEFDMNGFDDNDLIKCLFEAENKVKIKNDIKKQLEQKRTEIEDLVRKENKIKQQKLGLEEEAVALEQKLKNYQ